MHKLNFLFPRCTQLFVRSMPCLVAHCSLGMWTSCQWGIRILTKSHPLESRLYHVMSGLFPAVKSHVFILQFPSIRWVGQYFLSPLDLPGYDFSGGGRVDNSVSNKMISQSCTGTAALHKHEMITNNTGLWTVGQYNLWLGPANRNLLVEVTSVCGKVIQQKHAVCGQLKLPCF